MTRLPPDPPVPEPPESAFAPSPLSDGYTDGRRRWDWKSKYPLEARNEILFEARFLIGSLIVSLALAAGFLSVSKYSLPILLYTPVIQVAGFQGDDALILTIDFRILAIFFTGAVGGTTFSIKWLVHAAAKGTWHLDRRYWRTLIPFVGGVYACVILTFFDGGLLGGAQAITEPRPIPVAAAIAFLVGYFSDGVSGLLSNIANAVFGTLDKK